MSLGSPRPPHTTFDNDPAFNATAAGYGDEDEHMADPRYCDSCNDHASQEPCTCSATA